MRNVALAMMAALLPPAQDPGSPKLPDELRKAYDVLIRAFEAADVPGIRGCALQGALVITSEERSANRECGMDLNLPFLKHGFSKKVLRALEEDDGTYLLRTATSYLHFVPYRNGWKLYRYGDKPIE